MGTLAHGGTCIPMDLQRRLTLYLFGLLIGGGVSYWIYGKRITSGAWLPENKTKQRLVSTLQRSTPAADAQLVQWPATLEDVRLSIARAEVRFGESIRRNDSIYYALDGTVAGRDARIMIVGLRDFDRDSTATLWSLLAR